MSTQLFEEEAPSVAAPKNGRAPRTAPAPKPEITLTDPFADEPEVAVVEATQAPEPPQETPEPPQEVVAALVEVEPEPAPVPVVVAAPTPAATAAPVGARALPEERQSLTLTLKAGGCEGLVIVGLYDDGTPGEVLLLLRSAPTGAAAALEAYAATLTLALPYGVPATSLATQLLALVSEPSAHAAASAIARSLGNRFS